VLPATLPHLDPAGRIYALIKPQFEVGRERVGKGGIVRDESARQDALDGVLAAAEELGMSCLGTIASPITGAQGNIEFLAGWTLP
jgi:23S rRNA (cytidine1920-2'-O)/16S rRNA (cytidine1409-2'-O)-methyltransferase